MFEEVCSIYSDALDNYGHYVDMETGEIIQQMTIRDFCLTDRFRPQVEKLRQMRAVFGSKAKSMPEYIATKKQLPGATLSGLFAIYDDECTRRDGTKFIAPVSRRETHLQQHTGWLAIDIDLADNQNLSNFDNIRMICRFRPEIALLMRSCSGTGYFGLVRLAYPERHKEQFKALLNEYAAIGITLDKQCGNIGRVRFASWDDPAHIYINERAQPYKGIEQTLPPNPLPLRGRGSEYSGNGNYSLPLNNGGGQGWGSAFWSDPRTQDRLVELCALALASNHINITESYEEWCKAGWALKSHPYGERLFHALSACSTKYNAANTTHKWHQLGQSNTVTGNYIIHALKEYGGEQAYRALCRQVWQELHP